jgi:hypothetical protein
MIRQICWVERQPDGIKREVRVAFHGGRIKWQFKRADRPAWDYDSPADASDWDALLQRVEDRYQRRNVAYKDVELTRRCRAAALGLPPS